MCTSEFENCNRAKPLCIIHLHPPKPTPTHIPIRHPYTRVFESTHATKHVKTSPKHSPKTKNCRKKMGILERVQSSTGNKRRVENTSIIATPIGSKASSE